jgi:large subunit ribosomal protein L18
MRIQKRRRRENKTNYLKRRKMLQSKKPRIVFRKTNKYIIGQYILSENAQDKIELSANSRELIKYGWPKENLGSLKSIPAAYLTGFLLGTKAKGKQAGIFDCGMYSKVYKNKIFAFLKGLIDSGIEMQSKKEIFPEKEIIEGNKLKNKVNIQEIKQKISK